MSAAPHALPGTTASVTVMKQPVMKPQVKRTQAKRTQHEEKTAQRMEMTRHPIPCLVRTVCVRAAALRPMGLRLAGLLLAGLTMMSGLTVLAGFTGPTAQAAPRYADKDTALEMANALDKAVFRNSLIRSTNIQSVGRDQYLLKVVLDNGAELDWDMHQLRQLTRDEAITLKKNRVMLFPKQKSNEFAVLDKNQFTQQALRSKVLAKVYDETDVLAGQTIRYAIYQFNLLDLLNLAPGTDTQGYRQHYVFDLENGQRELMSYLDAYETLIHSGLVEDPTSAEPVMREPYRLKSVATHDLKMVNGTGRFGIEMVFDRPVLLEPGHFPFQLYEQAATAGRGPRNAFFVIEFTAPNTVLPAELSAIPTLEFLQNINAVSDQRHANRVLLRASLDPSVLNQPPEVEVQGADVKVTFTKVQDQTVFDRQALLEAELRRRQDKLLNGALTQDEINRRTTYRTLMETGLGQVDRARQRPSLQDRFDLLQSALTNFAQAAQAASTDRDLTGALKERNSVSVRLPQLVLERGQQALAQPAAQNKEDLKRDVQMVMHLTREPKTLAALSELLEALSRK